MILFKRCFLLALTCFTLGSLLVILNFLFPNTNELRGIGLLFVIVALLTNTAVVFGLMIRLILGITPKHTLNSIGILCINIPVATSYFLLILETL